MRIEIRLRRLLLALFLPVVLAGAHAQITPRQDAYTDSSKPTTNFGATTTLGVASTATSIQTSYMLFDLSSVPAGYTGANVGKATLKLYVNGVTAAGSFNIDFVAGSWVEKTITSNLAPALGTTIQASVPLSAANKSSYLLIDVTSALQAWLNGTQTNDGIALVANSPLAATFDSNENTAQSHPPELDVVFNGAITGINTAAGSGLTGGGSSGALNLSLLTSCNSGQTLGWSGSAWDCQTVKGAGTVTSVGSGLGLTGGPITATGALAIDPTQVPLLNATNIFTGSQTVNGNLSATGVVTGSSFQIGSDTFAFGVFSPTYNAFLGFAGNAATTGGGNTGTGPYALHFTTTGYHNTATGYTALTNNTAGSNNTAVGWSALSSSDSSANTAIGVQALSSNTTGQYNTATGINALYSNTTGSYNTAASSSSGYANDFTPVTGSLNTFLGTFSSMSTGSLSNTTAIGGAALVSQSNSIVLGSIAGVNGCGAVLLPSCTNTSVGIGTTTPVSSLHVLTSGTSPYGLVSSADAIGGECIGAGCTAIDAISSGAGGYGVYAVAAGSNGVALEGVAGGSALYAGGFIGNVVVSGCLTAGGTALGGACSSDARLKTNIQPFGASLDRIASLQPVHFNWRADNPESYRFGADTQTVGLIAQQVQEFFPDMVSTDKNGYKRVDYGRLPFLLLAGIRELKARNDRLSAQAREQQSRIASLSWQVELVQKAQQARIDQLTRQLQEVQAALRTSAPFQRKASEAVWAARSKPHENAQPIAVRRPIADAVLDSSHQEEPTTRK